MATRKNKPVDSVRHSDKRAHIPSREEAGQEEDAVKDQPKEASYPLNPVVHRGQDPELFWMHKYGPQDNEDRLKIDIRSLYRHEHVAPEVIIKNLYKLKGANENQDDLFVNELFGNALALDELDKPLSYYRQPDNWQNRLIQGDSLLVMASLLEREGMAGQVQMIYIDPPYGIKYGSNWQMKLNDRNVKDGADENLSGEPEVIKAFRDTWELGIHSYLSYLRERLLVAKDLLSSSGSCFVQISDENVHLVRCLMDEIFGSENFAGSIAFKKTGSFATDLLQRNFDSILWYAKDRETLKFRKLFVEAPIKASDTAFFDSIEMPDGRRREMTLEEKRDPSRIDANAKIFARNPLNSEGFIGALHFEFEFDGEVFRPPQTRHWTTTESGMNRLKSLGRMVKKGNTLRFVRYWDDYPVDPIGTVWTDTGIGGFVGDTRRYVVQTDTRVVARCILMTTDPGDLVLDPTCGSGTTAFVAEQWARRWIATDTSRIALNIAKTRLMTTTFPWYKLADPQGDDIRFGFVYKKVPHVTLKSLANDEPPEYETLFDQPEQEKKKLRVSGPFTVETLQNFDPVPPNAIDEVNASAENVASFTARVFEHLKSAGIKTGIKEETAVFSRVDLLAHEVLHAEGYYTGSGGEKKAYLHIGPQFGTVGKAAVNAAVRECRSRGDADWLVILGFAFESDIESKAVTTKVGGFEVTKVRMHDDLMQAGLIKKDKKAASFVTIGEPDIGKLDTPEGVVIEIRGLDIYDPVKDEVKPRSAADINYWMVDDDYDGASFVVRQVFFCGGDEDEFDKWKKGLSNLAAQSVKRAAERTLKIELDDEAFARVYGHRSHPIPHRKGRKVAVRVISQFGEESTKVIAI